MMKVYTANTPNGIKIPIVLEELGVEYTLSKLDLGNKDQKTAEFLEISPNGRIPAIVDEDVRDEKGKPITVFESGAIMLYLAEKYSGLLGKNDIDRVRALEWLFFQMGGVGPMFGQLSFFSSSEVFPSKNAVNRFAEESHRLASVLETRLKSNEWLAGSHYTIADIANYGWLRYAEGVGIELQEYPNIRAWRKAIESRPSIAKGLDRVENPDELFVDSLTTALQA